MSTGILPANIVEDCWTDYFPSGWVRTTLAHIAGASVNPPRSDSILSRDILTYSLETNSLLNVECFDLKVVTLTRQSDGATQGVQMWVQSGNRDDSPIVLNREKPSMLYWDFAQSGQPDGNPEHAFQVSIPGVGCPYALHEFYDQDYVIHTWYTQTVSRQFWAARHRRSCDIVNAAWVGDGPNYRRCTYYDEAWWVSGNWYFGYGDVGPPVYGGPFGMVSVSEPTGKGIVYGASETHAKYLTSMWEARSWLPSAWTEQALWQE